MKHTNYIVLAGLIGFTSLSAAQRPVFETTGTIYRNMKNNINEKVVAHPKYKTEEEHRALLHASHKTEIKGFKVVGNDELTDAEIGEVLAPFIGTELNKFDIAQAAAALTAYYHKKGVFTEETTFKPKSIKDGIVTLLVSERHLEAGGISVENKGQHIKSDKVLKLWNNIMKPGEMKQKEYERAMLLTNDFPGITAKADLYYGEEENTDDLVITVTDTDVFNGNIDIDNFGTYYTGRTQVGTTLYWNSPTGNGEEIVARFITTGKYSNFGYLDYALPVFDNGTRIGASIDYLDYELTNQSKGEGGDGSAWNANLYLKYPMVRTTDLNVEMEAKYTHTVLKDNNLTAQLDHTKIDKGVLTISGNRSDDLLLNGVTYFSAALTVGNIQLENANYKVTDALTSKTAGSYSKLNVSLQRLQNLVGDLSTKISVEGQWASKNLDTSEKYFLGGPYSAEAYPVGQIAGDNAALFYADLRYDFYKMPWGGDFQLKTFYSYGWAQLLKNPDTYSAYYGLDGKHNEMSIQSVGLGFSQTWTDSFVLRAMVAKQVGTNEYREIPVNNNEDYDQSDSDYRAWVEAIYYF